MEEALDSPGFWILGIGGITAEVLGYMMSKNAGWTVMPFWQLILMMVVTVVAAAFFATKD